MLLISVCTILILFILLIGFKSSRVINGQQLGFDNEYRIVAGKGVLIAFTLILVLTSTVRHGFIDTYAYKIMYMSVRNNLSYVDTNNWGIEAGWLYFLYTLNLISSNPKLMLFLSALIINAAYVKVIKAYSADVCFSLLISFSLNFLDTNNGIRQYVAAAITILAFPLLQKKKVFGYILYCLFVALAYQMHKSAIVCLLIMLLVTGKPLNYRTIAAFTVGTIVAVFPQTVSSLLTDIFGDDKYASYLSVSSSMSFFRFLVSGIIPGAFVLIYVIKMKKQGREISYAEGLLLNMLFINTLFVFMGTRMQYWSRLGFYTSFASFVLMPKFIYELFKKQHNIIRVIAVMCYLFFFCYNVYVNVRYGAMSSFYIDLS